MFAGFFSRSIRLLFLSLLLGISVQAFCWGLTGHRIVGEIAQQHLSKKTGEPEQTVARLVEMIHEVRTSGTAPDEPYLYELYTTIQQFYKNNEH